MAPLFLKELKARSAIIRGRWEALLRVEGVPSPLANPDMLVHLIPESLAEVFRLVAYNPTSARTVEEAKADRLPPCDCGNNPYLAYFLAGEQALSESVILLQSEQPRLGAKETDLAEVIGAVRDLARAEIDTFCGICTHHGTAPRCRHAAAAR